VGDTDRRPIGQDGPLPICRRAMIAGAAGLCADLVPRLGLTQIAPQAARDRPIAGDLLLRATGDDHRPLTVGDVALGEKPIMAWPLAPDSGIVRSGSRLNKVLVLHLNPDQLDAPTKANAADGVLAYSAICPHTGCDVANWHAAEQILECPCHFSHYDPKAGAKVISGPSPRRLAALPLTSDSSGKLAVAKPFIGRLGVQQDS
jgi:rieske iron-sulfur protein